MHTVAGVMRMRAVLSLLMLAVMLVRPDQSTQAARQALRVWGLDVAPSLFPYMVLCRMVSAHLRRARIPAAPTAALLGLLGGSPAGASVLAAYGGSLSRSTLLPLCALTGTISPMFFLSTLSGWLRDTALCRQILAAHLAGAVLCALLLRALAVRYSLPAPDACADAPAAADPIAQSIQAILSVGGCIVFFSVAADALQSLPFIGVRAGALMHAALEAAGGIHALCVIPCGEPMRAVLIASASAFSGISILSQNLVFLRPMGIGMKTLTSIALLRALLAGMTMSLLLLLR